MPKMQHAPVTAAGLYRYDGTVYRVKPGESGHLYAQALTEKAGGGWTYTYTRGMMRKLTPAHRLTLDEAKAFGQQFGSCCVCARTLTNPDSIAAGIGPICREKF